MKEYLPVIAIIIAVIALFTNFGGSDGDTVQFGATQTSTTASAIDAAAYAVNGTTTISDRWVLTVSSGVYSGGVTVGETLNVTGETNLDSLIQGGDVTALTGASAVTVTAAQACNSAILTWADNNTTTASTTLPSADTMFSDCLDTDGDSKTVMFRNTAALATRTAGIFTGASSTLLEPDGQNVVIAGGNSAWLRFLRASSTVMVVTIDELIDAD